MATSKDSPSRRAQKFVVRMPTGLRDRITHYATRNHRSMNAEVVARLLNSLDNDEAGSLGVKEPTPIYSSEESQLIIIFRRLPEKKRRALLDLVS